MNQKRFSPALAVVDAVPVILFLISCIIFGSGMHSHLFLIGAVLCFLAGAGKVLWKIFLSLTAKDYAWLNRYFLPVMLTGFVLLIVSIVLAIHGGKFPSAYLLHLTRGGVIIAFGIALLFLIALVVVRAVFRKEKFNTSEALNWAGEALNIGFQTAVLAGVIQMQ